MRIVALVTTVLVLTTTTWGDHQGSIMDPTEPGVAWDSPRVVDDPVSNNVGDDLVSFYQAYHSFRTAKVYNLDIRVPIRVDVPLVGGRRLSGSIMAARPGQGIEDRTPMDYLVLLEDTPAVPFEVTTPIYQLDRGSRRSAARYQMTSEPAIEEGLPGASYFYIANLIRNNIEKRTMKSWFNEVLRARMADQQANGDAAGAADTRDLMQAVTRTFARGYPAGTFTFGRSEAIRALDGLVLREPSNAEVEVVP